MRIGETLKSHVPIFILINYSRMTKEKEHGLF